MDTKEMRLTDHLEEFRRRLIMTVLAFVTFLIANCIFVQDIYNWLVKDLDGKLAILGPSDILWVYMMIAAVFSVAGTIPVAATRRGVLWHRR